MGVNGDCPIYLSYLQRAALGSLFFPPAPLPAPRPSIEHTYIIFIFSFFAFPAFSAYIFFCVTFCTMKELSSSGAANLWTAVSMFILGFVAIAIRLAVRLWARIPLTWSDWLIISSLLTIGVYSGFIIQCKETALIYSIRLWRWGHSPGERKTLTSCLLRRRGGWPGTRNI